MYHLSAKKLTRRKIKSVVASAAYRSGAKLYDERQKRHHDYTKKEGVVHVESMAPPDTPAWLKDRETKWNTVERMEKRKDACLAREIEVALPRELTLAEQIELARAFINDNFICLGMCADLCIHHKTVENPHAHILLTDRPVNRDGFMPKKDPSWNERRRLIDWRKDWERMLNWEYERMGLEKRVTHRSYKALGITDRKPTKHLGYRVLKYAERGQMTDRFLEHLKILHSDRERERLMLRSLEQVRNPRDRERLMAQFLEIAVNAHLKERLTSRFIEILDHSKDRERHLSRSYEHSR